MMITTSCVASVNPLYLEPDIVFDREILGVWTDEEQVETWVFSDMGAKEYKLVYTDEDGKVGQFRAHLFMIGGKLFLDLAPIVPRLSDNNFYRSHFVTLHTFVYVMRDKGELRISYLEPEWLKAELKRNPSAIGHINLDGEIVLTDSTEKLQSFITGSLSAPGGFSQPTTMKRKIQTAKTGRKIIPRP